MNIESKLEGYENFLKSFATGTEYSALWDKYRKDFTVSANSTSKARQRGYGINCEGDTRSSLYISVFTRANYIFTRLSMLLSKLVANLLSLMLFGNFDTKTKYGFDYPIDVRKAIRAQDPELLDAYAKKNPELGWSYSHNSFKSFFHFFLFFE